MSTSSQAIPIACTLDPGALRARIGWIKSLYARSLRHHRLVGDTLHLSFGRDASAQVRQWIRDEQECCRFLNFHVDESGNEIRLAITVPAGTDAKALLSPFLPEETLNEAPVSTCCCS